MSKSTPPRVRPSRRTKLALHRGRASGRHRDNIVLAILVAMAGLSALAAAGYAAGWYP